MSPNQSEPEAMVLHVFPVKTCAATLHMETIAGHCRGLARESWVFNGVDDGDWCVSPPCDDRPFYTLDVIVRDAERTFCLMPPVLNAWNKVDATWGVDVHEVYPDADSGELLTRRLPSRTLETPWWHGDAAVVAAEFFHMVATECVKSSKYLAMPQFERSSPSKNMYDFAKRWIVYFDSDCCATETERDRAMAACMLLAWGMEASQVRRALGEAKEENYAR